MPTYIVVHAVAKLKVMAQLNKQIEVYLVPDIEKDEALLIHSEADLYKNLERGRVSILLMNFTS